MTSLISKEDSGTKFTLIFWVFFIIIGILALILIPQIVGIESIETVTEKVEYISTAIETDMLESGNTCKKPSGEDGILTKKYKVTRSFGKEKSRELLSEEITKEAKNETVYVGTGPHYDGYCAVEGKYRKRYAACYGNYSPESKQKAEEQASICNTSPKNETGCNNTYDSKNINGYKSCLSI